MSKLAIDPKIIFLQQNLHSVRSNIVVVPTSARCAYLSRVC